MHARLSYIEGSVDSIDAGVKSFREQVVPGVRDNGGKAAYLLLDRQTGKALAVTLWETQEALRASEELANALRAQAAEEMHAMSAPRVERYEVVVSESF
jgi:heme-degrading monooxygenase HmoA